MLIAGLTSAAAALHFQHGGAARGAVSTFDGNPRAERPRQGKHPDQNNEEADRHAVEHQLQVLQRRETICFNNHLVTGQQKNWEIAMSTFTTKTLLLLIAVALWGILLRHDPRSAEARAEPGAAALRAPKLGEFTAVSIAKQPGTESAFDIRLDGGGRAMRFFQNVKGDPHPGDAPTYFNDAGMLYTRGWIVISGTTSGTGQGYNIDHPTPDPSMLAIWSDVLGPAVQVRAANAGAASYLFQGLDRKANYTFSIEQNGTLRWGASTRAGMDASLYRAAANTLKTDGSLVVAGRSAVGAAGPASTLHVGGSQSVHRITVKADHVLTDGDHYVGVTDTSAARTVTLPPATDRSGRVYVVKDESGGAGVHAISVQPHAGEKIDGADSLMISTAYGHLRVISDGKQWFSM